VAKSKGGKTLLSWREPTLLRQPAHRKIVEGAKTLLPQIIVVFSVSFGCLMVTVIGPDLMDSELGTRLVVGSFVVATLFAIAVTSLFVLWVVMSNRVNVTKIQEHGILRKLGDKEEFNDYIGFESYCFAILTSDDREIHTLGCKVKSDESSLLYPYPESVTRQQIEQILAERLPYAQTVVEKIDLNKVHTV
jgi:hypothetical protein